MSFKYKSEFEKKKTEQFCKCVLGLHSKACNFAGLSERVQFLILISCLNF